MLDSKRVAEIRARYSQIIIFRFMKRFHASRPIVEVHTFNVELIFKILFIRAILEAHCKFAARMESTSWPALSVGALAALRPIFQEFVQEYPNSPRGF